MNIWKATEHRIKDIAERYRQITSYPLYVAGVITRYTLIMPTLLMISHKIRKGIDTMRAKKQQAVVDKIVEELRPLVQEIENGPETTRYHYRDYMNILAKYPEEKDQRYTMAVLLIKAGANPEGVEWAARLAFIE